MVKKTMTAPLVVVNEMKEPLRLDLGCGKNKREERDAAGNVTKKFLGVDNIDFGQDLVFDLRGAWPWEDESVAEAWSSHFVEHLAGLGPREHFFNELYRVMEFGATATIIAPHWSNDCAYGDPTHAWPPMSSWSHLYWNKGWRDMNAPHCAYTCDFDCVVGFSEDSSIQPRNQEYKMFAINHYRNGARDVWYNLVKTKR